MICLTPDLQKRVEDFLSQADNRGHVDRGSHLANPLSYVTQNLQYAMETIERAGRDTPEMPHPKTILDLGCSNGFKVVALKRQYPDAHVYGIDPENDAVNMAQSLVNAEGLANITLQCGVGESLPYPDESFDLITCHTVIEHVYDVEKVVLEIGRVLKKGGVLHLDAPNYLWPYEPHLRIYCIPLLGKRLMKFFAHIQGQGHNVDFMDHLQLIEPFRVNRAIRYAGLRSHNLLSDYVDEIVSGRKTAKRFKRIGKAMTLLQRTRLHRPLVRFMVTTGLYPMMLMKVVKPA